MSEAHPATGALPIDARLRSLASESLRAACGTASLIFVFNFVLHLSAESTGARLPILIHDLILAFGWGVVWLRARDFKHPDLWVLALGWSATSDVLHTMVRVASPRQDAFTVLLVVAGAALLASRRLLTVYVAVIVSVWFAISASHPQIDLGAQRLGLMVSAVAIAYLLNQVRIYGGRRTEAFRDQAQQQRKALQQALESARSEIEERARVERELKASESRFQELFAHLSDGIATLQSVDDGADFIITDLNRASFQLDPKRIVGRRLRSVAPELIRSRVLEDLKRTAINGTEVVADRFPLALFDRVVFVHYSLFRLPAGEVVAVFRDQTDAVHAEQARDDMREKLLHTQKLESLGVMAGGIAHDFNNLLMGVLANAEAAKLRLEDPQFLGECLEDVRTAAEQAAGLCRQLLGYAGQGKLVPEAIVVDELIKDLDVLLDAGISKKTKITYEFDKERVRVHSDLGQMRQVIVNLVTNASDAGAKRVTVATRCCHLGRNRLEKAAIGSELKPGRYACITVTDDGEGIDANDLRRVFDPFFTTRFIGRGLGLSAVAGIVRSHNGAVFLRSTRGEGTEITIALEALPRERVPSLDAPTIDPPNERPHVLLVDDDVRARRSVRRLLELEDISITEAEDGEEAVAVAREQGARFDVVLLDLTMPRRGGIDAFPELAENMPQARIVLMSGYDASADGVSRIVEHPNFGGFLTKPYTLAMLREAVEVRHAVA